jgi:hypothetical protein
MLDSAIADPFHANRKNKYEFASRGGSANR